jgi:hypothetical protein
MQSQALPISQQPAQQRWYTRQARGVITEYSMYINGCFVQTEIFRGQASRCTCKIAHCQHGKIAVQLEQQYQDVLKEAHDALYGSCYQCGVLSKIVKGIAICSRCNN